MTWTTRRNGSWGRPGCALQANLFALPWPSIIKKPWAIKPKWRTPWPSYKAHRRGALVKPMFAQASSQATRLRIAVPSGEIRKQLALERNLLVPQENWCQSHEKREPADFSRETHQPVPHRTGSSHLSPLFGKNSIQYFLIDTGAQIRIFPATRADRVHKSDITLRGHAANNSSINTHG